MSIETSCVKATSIIEGVIGSLKSEEAALEKNLNKLIDRLKPAMLPEPPSPKAEKTPTNTQLSELALSIRNVAERLQNHNIRILDVLNVLQL